MTISSFYNVRLDFFFFFALKQFLFFSSSLFYFQCPTLRSLLCANMLIRCGAPGADVAFHLCHSGPTFFSHPVFTIKYSQASSVQFWARHTCYGVSFRHHSKDPHPDRPLKNEGRLSQLCLAADITSNLFGSGCHAFLICFAEGNCLLLDCLTHCHLFIFSQPNHEIFI